MRIKLDIPLDTQEIALATKGISDRKETVSYIVTDSREAKKNDLFIALKGERFNGEDFIDDAINKGALPLSSEKRNPGIIVSDTTQSLLDIAKYYKTKLKKLIKTIAITGSVGKTTTKEFLKVILSSAYKVHATPGNMNNEIGLPLTVLSARSDTEILILEMGMNHSGEIKRMSEAISPDIAIITNIGTAHIGNLGSRENIAKAKLEITSGNSNCIMIVPFEEKLIPYLNSNITFSTSRKEADYCIESNKSNLFSIYSSGELISQQSLFFSDRHLYECLSSAVACASEIGTPKEQVIRGISMISSVNIRQRLITKGNLSFISDCYNASFESVIAAIDSLKRIEGYSAKSLVLGDILELGDLSKRIHKKIGENISSLDFTSLYLIGSHAKYIYDGAVACGFAKDRIYYNPNLDKPEITASQIKRNAIVGEILLLKASRSVRLERILDYFDD